MTLFSESQKQNIVLLLQQDRKIEAIKWVIDNSDLGLKEAKDYVESLAMNPNEATTQSLTDSSISPMHAQEIYALIQQGRKIEAIKLVKKYSTLNLKDAKEFVENLITPPNLDNLSSLENINALHPRANESTSTRHTTMTQPIGIEDLSKKRRTPLFILLIIIILFVIYQTIGH